MTQKDNYSALNFLHYVIISVKNSGVKVSCGCEGDDMLLVKGTLSGTFFWLF